jgi:hypothetical protein
MTQASERLETETILYSSESSPSANSLIYLFFSLRYAFRENQSIGALARSKIVTSRATFFRRNKDSNFVQKAKIIKSDLLLEIQTEYGQVENSFIRPVDINKAKILTGIITGLSGIKFNQTFLQKVEESIEACQSYLDQAGQKTFPNEGLLYLRPLYQSLHSLIESIQIPE